MANNRKQHYSTVLISLIVFFSIWLNSSEKTNAQLDNSPPLITKSSKSVSSSALSDETKVYPIDREQQDCINKNSTTEGMINCTEKAYIAWDQELNKNYSELKKQLSPDGKQLLEASQLEWIKYRDKELKLLNHLYEKTEGSMYRVMCVQDRVNLVKERALELEEYLSLNYVK